MDSKHDLWLHSFIAFFFPFPNQTNLVSWFYSFLLALYFLPLSSSFSLLLSSSFSLPLSLSKNQMISNLDNGIVREKSIKIGLNTFQLCCYFDSLPHTSSMVVFILFDLVAFIWKWNEGEKDARKGMERNWRGREEERGREKEIKRERNVGRRRC